METATDHRCVQYAAKAFGKPRKGALSGQSIRHQLGPAVFRAAGLIVNRDNPAYVLREHRLGHHQPSQRGCSRAAAISAGNGPGACNCRLRRSAPASGVNAVSVLRLPALPRSTHGGRIQHVPAPMPGGCCAAGTENYGVDVEGPARGRGAPSMMECRNLRLRRAPRPPKPAITQDGVSPDSGSQPLEGQFRRRDVDDTRAWRARSGANRRHPSTGGLFNAKRVLWVPVSRRGGTGPSASTRRRITRTRIPRIEGLCRFEAGLTAVAGLMRSTTRRAPPPYRKLILGNKSTYPRKSIIRTFVHHARQFPSGVVDGSDGESSLASPDYGQKATEFEAARPSRGSRWATYGGLGRTLKCLTRPGGPAARKVLAEGRSLHPATIFDLFEINEAFAQFWFAEKFIHSVTSSLGSRQKVKVTGLDCLLASRSGAPLRS